jgi:hypothetical protein
MSDNGKTPDSWQRLIERDPVFAQHAREAFDRDKNPTEEGRPADPWQPFTLADAYIARPPVDYIAAGLFALPSLNIVYGAPGTLKSFILADLCACAAAGQDWLPPAPWRPDLTKSFPTKQAPTMWLDFDNGRRRTHDRFGALGRARDLPPDLPLTYYSMPSPWLNANDKTSMGELINRVNDLGAKLVCIDNLGVVSGDAEENSSEMAQVMSFFRQLAEDTEAAVVLIHHQRKTGIAVGRSGDALRGHSSIEAALDLALMIEREEYADTVSIKATKVRGADVLPFAAVFTYESKPEDPDELVKAKFYGLTSEDTKSAGAIERAILEAINGERLNKTALTEAVKKALPDVGVNRIRDMVDRLVGKKLFMAPGEKPGERVYSKL